MSDMPEIIWVYDGAYDDHTWVEHDPSYNDYIGGGTKYIRQSAINVPDGLEDILSNGGMIVQNKDIDTIKTLIIAARELLRLKGLKHGQD